VPVARGDEAQHVIWVTRSIRFSIMDAGSGKESKPIKVAGASLGPVPPDPLSPDGKTLVIMNAALNELRFLDSETGKDRFPVAAFRRPVKAVAFSPDGRFVAAATGRGGGHETAAPSEVVIWDAATGKELARLTESLFIAALGRFPTDVEARTLAAQVARRDDTAAALRDLLGTLIETTEFRTHAEELGRLAK
jgi:WD40 repeat protein